MVSWEIPNKVEVSFAGFAGDEGPERGPRALAPDPTHFQCHEPSPNWGL